MIGLISVGGSKNFSHTRYEQKRNNKLIKKAQTNFEPEIWEKTKSVSVRYLSYVTKYLHQYYDDCEDHNLIVFTYKHDSIQWSIILWTDVIYVPVWTILKFLPTFTLVNSIHRDRMTDHVLSKVFDSMGWWKCLISFHIDFFLSHWSPVLVVLQIKSTHFYFLHHHYPFYWLCLCLVSKSVKFVYENSWLVDDNSLWNKIG